LVQRVVNMSLPLDGNRSLLTVIPVRSLTIFNGAPAKFPGPRVSIPQDQRCGSRTCVVCDSLVVLIGHTGDTPSWIERSPA
jgi:hypothetical protein